MSKRKNAPALFEVMKQRQVKKAQSTDIVSEDEIDSNVTTPPPPPKQSPATTAAPTTTADQHEHNSLGKTIRIPLGYIFIAVAGVIGMIIISYSVGFARGRQDEITRQEDIHAASLSNTTYNTDRNTQIPTSNLPSNNDHSTNQTQPLSRETQQPSPENNRTIGQSNTRSDTIQTNPLYRDSRQSGLNYIIVERFDRDEAERVANFLRTKGIDVMILPANNNRSLWQVLVRQGFEGWLSNREAQRTLERVKRHGQEWLRLHSGSKDFEQAFGKKFDR